MSARPVTVLVVESDLPQVQARGEALAQKLNLQIRGAAPETDELFLALNEHTLELRDAHTRPGRGVIVDLAGRASSKGRGSSRNQPLGRAIGKTARIVIDATAGLGQDTGQLAMMGYLVFAVERSPVLAAMLHDGLQRALQHENQSVREFAQRITIVQGDARELLTQNSSSARRIDIKVADVDAVYIDPMFPPKRRKSALASKEIRWVRELVGDDDDAAELLKIARQQSARAVVKRPTYAPPLLDPASFSIETKLVRYDVYVSAGPGARENKSQSNVK